jgi:hypothetical protein
LNPIKGKDAAIAAKAGATHGAAKQIDSRKLTPAKNLFGRCYAQFAFLLVSWLRVSQAEARALKCCLYRRSLQMVERLIKPRRQQRDVVERTLARNESLQNRG